MWMTRSYFVLRTLNSWLTLKKTLVLFQLASGLQVNFHKSSLIGVKVDSHHLARLAAHLQCNMGLIPFTYLGLPIGGSISRINLWDPIIAKNGEKVGNLEGQLVIYWREGYLDQGFAFMSSYILHVSLPDPKGSNREDHKNSE